MEIIALVFTQTFLDSELQINKFKNLFKLLYIMTTVWYGKSSAKQLQLLIDNKPKLISLLSLTDFQQQLKSYNTKLLQYITNNPSLIGQAIQLLTAAPQATDTYQRKHKYPLQAIQMIQTETTCILNSFFKEVSQGNNNGNYYFDSLFNILNQKQILPLLAGYFFRTNLCLLNNRYKQSIDRIYLKPQILKKLLNHCNLMPIANTIQLYLNLDVNKSPQSLQQRLDIKKDLLQSIIAKIDFQRRQKSIDSSLVIQNLIVILIESIQKYYLILDGKAMMDIISSQQTIDVMINLIKQNSQISHNAFNFFISLINYYSFSSYNSDQGDSPQVKRKNLQRLQSQPMVSSLNIFFPLAVQKIKKVKLFTLYQYRLLQILCHCISISSLKIFQTICQTNFFGNLISLLFNHEDNNILHMLIQKSFLHVFISERKIYDDYKKHLFCDLDIIQITASRIIKLYPEAGMFQALKKKRYFGHFMRILKIYSGIQTTDESIIAAIKSKTQVWNKISTILIKPYENICFKELGTYQNVPQPKNQQFIMKKIENNAVQPLKQNTNVLQQIRKEQMMQALVSQKRQESSIPFNSKQVDEKNHEKHKEQQLLKAPTHNLITDVKSFQIKKTESFKDFMSKKKVQAEHQIKLKRSLSKQKSLTGSSSRGKMTNPSPNKKNSWRQEKNDIKPIHSSTKNDGSLSPKMHIPKKSNSTTSNTIQFSDKNSRTSIQQNRFNEQNQNGTINPSRSQQLNLQTKSLPSTSKEKATLQSIKKIKVIVIDAPKQKKYRRIQDRDMPLLDFLGISR